MKRILFFTVLSLTLLSNSQAQYVIKYHIEPSPNAIKLSNWTDSTPFYSNWENISELYNCTEWNPDNNSIIIGQDFEQQRECQIDQRRTKQNRIQSTSGIYKNVGEPILEYRTEIVTETRNNTGLLEQWVLSNPIYSEWINTGSLYECSNWTPSENTVNKGEVFTQTATDCKQNQIRTRQDREQEITTLVYRNIGPEIEETNVLLGQVNTRTAVGTLETWISAEPLYSEWINSGTLYDCNNWSPDPSTVNYGVSFTQTATDCKQNQTRTRQNREQESVTLEYRNVGNLITETNTLTSQTNTRTSTGTLSNKVCLFEEYYNSNVYIWYTGSGQNQFWMSNYQTIPSLWIDVTSNTQVSFFGELPPLPAGLSKISDNEYRYNDGNKNWKITRGSYIKYIDGYYYYQICFE